MTAHIGFHQGRDNCYSLLVIGPIKISVGDSDKCGIQSTLRSSYINDDIYPKESSSYYRDTSLAKFIVAFLIIVMNWKHPRCPPTR